MRHSDYDKVGIMLHVEHNVWKTLEEAASNALVDGCPGVGMTFDQV